MNTVKTRVRVARPAPITQSTRSYALFPRSSHTHVQAVRDAVAETFIQIQKNELQELRRADHVILEIALDETEEHVTMEVRSEICHVMTIHAKMLMRRGVNLQRIELVMPPALVENTRAESLLGGVINRLPLSLERIKSIGDVFTLVVNSDSGPSCLKLGRELAKSVPTVQAICGCIRVAWRSSGYCRWRG